MNNRTVASLIKQLRKLSPDTEIWGLEDGSIYYDNYVTGESGSIECVKDSSDYEEEIQVALKDGRG